MMISGVIFLLTLQFTAAFCQRDEYTADRQYYKYGLGLTAIPTDIPTDALEVYIWGNSIIKIEANAFSELSECTRLVLNSNRIAVVEQGAFNGLTALTYLVLRSNSLERLHVNMFSNLTSCTGLDLQNNQIHMELNLAALMVSVMLRVQFY